MGRRAALFIRLTTQQSVELEVFMREMARRGNRRARLRGNAIFLSFQYGWTAQKIAGHLNCSTPSVVSWLKHYQEKGIAGLYDIPTPARRLTPFQVEQITGAMYDITQAKSKRRYRKRLSYRETARLVKEKYGINISYERVRQIVRQNLLGAR
ncbi:MAG: helix-turn-helix domain-containing protein [Planctomycetes bacterium]|nr:helix-turn-helix domain-containing protein [Planctomycetota bacterium]